MLKDSKIEANEFDNLAFSEDSLQRYLKERKIGFIKRFSILVVLWLLIIGYFVSPISKVGTPKVTGIKNLTISDIIDIARVNSTDYLWDNNTEEQVELLARHPLIKDVEITVNIFGMYIEIEETYPIAKIQSSSTGSNLADFNYYFSDLSLVDGETVFQSNSLTSAITNMANLPLISNIDNNEIINSILKQLVGIDYNILQNIIEISYDKNYLETNQIDVVCLKIAKKYLNLDADLILYVDMNRVAYKINEDHLRIIAKYIKSSAKLDDSNYCLSYLSNETASCKYIVR